ncbi:MAG: SMEK domain-containing protein [Oscillospiraceae bacterium]|nr:SMEK domain-containing protein [Oscillospiraceae bacterium]
MDTHQMDEIIPAFYRWDAKIKSCKAQDLYDVCRLSQSLACRLLNLLLGIHLVDLDRMHRNFPGVDLGESGGFCVQVTSQISASKVTHTLRQCQKQRLGDRYTGLIFLFLSFEKPNYDLKKAAQMVEGIFSNGVRFWDFKDLLNQFGHLAKRDVLRFSQAKELLNAPFLQDDLPVPAWNFPHRGRKCLDATGKCLLILLAMTPLLLQRVQVMAFLQQFWLFVCAGALLSFGAAALCWHSERHFRQVIHLPSYHLVSSAKSDPFSVQCTQDRFWGRQQVYLKNNSGQTLSYVRGTISFYSGNTLVHSVPLAMEGVGGRRAVLLDTLYVKQNPLYAEKTHWDEIFVDAQLLTEGSDTPLSFRKTVYQAHLTYYAILNYYHYWHLFGWRLPFETTWLTGEFFYWVKSFFLYWPRIPRAYGAVPQIKQLFYWIIRFLKRVALICLSLLLLAFLLAALAGLVLTVVFYIGRLFVILQNIWGRLQL